MAKEFTLQEVLLNANVDLEIKKALCVGPAHELIKRIDRAEDIIIENIKIQLQTYLAHRVIALGRDATAFDLYKDMFPVQE